MFMCSTTLQKPTVNTKRPRVTPSCASICQISNLPHLMKVEFYITGISLVTNFVFSNAWNCHLVQGKLWNMSQIIEKCFISFNIFIGTPISRKIKYITYSETERQNMLCAFSRSNKNCLACSGPSSSLARILFNSMSLQKLNYN